MPNYRRAFVPGGCWFFTANLLDRRSTLLTGAIRFAIAPYGCISSGMRGDLFREE
jgi:hypothetical protein